MLKDQSKELFECIVIAIEIEKHELETSYFVVINMFIIVVCKCLYTFFFLLFIENSCLRENVIEGIEDYD